MLERCNSLCSKGWQLAQSLIRSAESNRIVLHYTRGKTRREHCWVFSHREHSEAPPVWRKRSNFARSCSSTTPTAVRHPASSMRTFDFEEASFNIAAQQHHTAA